METILDTIRTAVLSLGAPSNDVNERLGSVLAGQPSDTVASVLGLDVPVVLAPTLAPAADRAAVAACWVMFGAPLYDETGDARTWPDEAAAVAAACGSRIDPDELAGMYDAARDRVMRRRDDAFRAAEATAVRAEREARRPYVTGAPVDWSGSAVNAERRARRESDARYAALRDEAGRRLLAGEALPYAPPTPPAEYGVVTVGGATVSAYGALVAAGVPRDQARAVLAEPRYLVAGDLAVEVEEVQVTVTRRIVTVT